MQNFCVRVITFDATEQIKRRGGEESNSRYFVIPYFAHVIQANWPNWNTNQVPKMLVAQNVTRSSTIYAWAFSRRPPTLLKKKSIKRVEQSVHLVSYIEIGCC